MLTGEGQALVASATLGQVANPLILVSDGSEVVKRPVDDGFPRLSEDGKTIIFQATFGPEEANFEWSAEGIEVDGEVIEWEENDSGRKALGATWTVQIELSVSMATGQ